jgi:hypothetical protein
LTLVKDISARRSTPYAVAADFCRVFAEDTNGLYLLAWLLTADRVKAEECFVAGLEDSMKSNRIFKDWARSWSRRLVIQNAIRVIAPTPDMGREKEFLGKIDTAAELKSESSVTLSAVLTLPTFERFVFVMSVLEHYSDQDCSILLNRSRRDVARARSQAAEHVASFANPNLAGVTSVGALAQPSLVPASA